MIPVFELTIRHSFGVRSPRVAAIRDGETSPPMSVGVVIRHEHSKARITDGTGYRRSVSPLEAAERTDTIERSYIKRLYHYKKIFIRNCAALMLMGTSSSDDSETDTGSIRKDWRDGYNAKQHTFDNIIVSLRDEVRAKTDDERWPVEHPTLWPVQTQLHRARLAVSNEEYPEALASYYRAERAWLEYLPEFSPGEKFERELHNRAKSIVTLSRQSVPLSDRTAITQHLTDETGAVREDIETSDLISAMEAFHTYTVKRYETAESVRAYLRLGILGLFAAIVGFLAFLDPPLMVATLREVVDSSTGVDSFTLFLTAAELPVPTLQSPVASVDYLELVFVIAIGLGGAGFSMLYQAYKNPNEIQTPDPRFPSPSFGIEGTASRFLVGAVSALLLYSILMSSVTEGVLDLGLREDRWAIALLAFTAGYSERILDRTLSRLEERFAV